MTVATDRILRIRNHKLTFGMRTYVMGIVNATPDSFSKDGITDVKKAVTYALSLIEKGADIIDIGGQSTRPGHTAIDEKEELARIIPVIAELRKVSDIVISVDTFSPLVLEKALTNGADILNSIWGLTDELTKTLKYNPVPVIIMHNKLETVYANSVVKEVREYLSSAAQKALAAGLAHEQIILDPGIGFGKTADQNIELISNIKEIVSLGFPVLIGTSRKSTIGKLTDQPVDKRAFGTAATVAYAIVSGVDIVRVHDVEEIMDVAKVTDALVRNWRPENWQE